MAGLGRSAAGRRWRAWPSMGLLVLVLSPLFVRLAWPTRPLPPGPLRDRLEHLAKRFGFRCTDILVWDTGHVLVNAGVTGALPWFRYVLLTDALIENLNPLEVAAVFGHEIGHIAHRHLFYFGFFFVGSLGVMALLAKVIDAYLMPISPLLAPDRPGRLRCSCRSLQSGLGLLSLAALLPGGLRSRLAAVRAAGRRLRLPGRLVRPARLPAPRRPRQPPGHNPGHRSRSARSASGSSPTPWPTWPRSTAWSTGCARGGTAASAGGSPSSRASKAGPRPSGGSRPGSAGSGLGVALALIAVLVYAMANGRSISCAEHLAMRGRSFLSRPSGRLFGARFDGPRNLRKTRAKSL